MLSMPAAKLQCPQRDYARLEASWPELRASVEGAFESGSHIRPELPLFLKNQFWQILHQDERSCTSPETGEDCALLQKSVPCKHKQHGLGRFCSFGGNSALLSRVSKLCLRLRA